MLEPQEVPTPAGQELDFETLKAAFLQHKQLKNFSPLTVKQKDQHIRYFIEFLHEQGIISVHFITRDIIEQYKARMSTHRTRKDTALLPDTIRERVFAVQDWLRFLKKKGVIQINPGLDVEVPKGARRLPRGVFSAEELRRIMAQPDINTLVGYRDRTIMEVLYSTGVRAAELISLTVQDVDLDKKVARVRNGKGAKERFVLISTPCARFLGRYLAEIRPALVPGIRFSGNNWHKKFKMGGDLLFLSVYGGQIGSAWLGQIMRDYITKAGITRPVSPVHSFRHTVATHLMESGMDVRFVQVFLGHNSINSTQIYTHVERATLKKHFKECHPLELNAGEVKPFMGTAQ